MPSNLRRLAPKRTAIGSDAPQGHEHPGRRPRQTVKAACGRCKSRKAKCDGRRPICTPCSKRNVDCVWEAEIDETPQIAVKRKFQQVSEDARVLTELFDALKTQSEEVAYEAYRLIRQGKSPRAILGSIVGDTSAPNALSVHATNRATLPPTQTPLEFELVAQHPNAYPSLVPLDLASLNLQLLGIRPLEAFDEGSPEAFSFFQEPSTSSTVNPWVIAQREPGMDLVDARLYLLNISYWTDIAINNRFAAEAVSLYLKMNQPWWAFFDADLFLDDLISGETRFCSRLLVNALLAWSCQSYAHYEPSASALSAKFLDKASRMYDTERHVDSLTTIAATSLMSMTWTTLGKDRVGHSLQCDSASMAGRLCLYHMPGSPACNTLDLRDEKEVTAASATAWGSFNFQMVMSMSYHQAPLPRGLPNFPIPGNRHSRSDPSRPYSGSTYISVCQFWSIAFEMNNLFYSLKAPTLPGAVAIYQKLLAWMDTLQEDVKRDERNPDHVLNLHIWFHTAVIDLFRPFVGEQPQQKIPSFAAEGATPMAVVAASIKQLKHLVYQYRTHCESAKYSIIWQSGMLYLVNHILQDYSTKEAHFYFLLCMRGYQHLARHMPFVGGVAQSLLAMAMRLGTILPDDARRVLTEVRGENSRTQEFLSAYPVDLQVASTNLPGASLEHLARDIEELVLENDLETPERTERPQGWKGDLASLSTTLAEGEAEID